MISIIAAMDRNQNIGFQGDMPWGRSMKSDLKRFKDLTTGKIVVMGRKTYESIGDILPNRTNVIMTHSVTNLTADVIKNGTMIAKSVEEVLSFHSYMRDDVEIFIIGGAQVYKQFLPHADKIYLTNVHAYLDGDTKFPSITGKWDIHREHYPADENNQYAYTFTTYKKGE